MPEGISFFSHRRLLNAGCEKALECRRLLPHVCGIMVTDENNAEFVRSGVLNNLSRFFPGHAVHDAGLNVGIESETGENARLKSHEAVAGNAGPHG